MQSDSVLDITGPPSPGVAAEVVRLRRWARLVLVPVGLIGAALSFASIYDAAVPSYGPVLAAGFPFLVDFLILGASLQYIAGAKVGRPRAGWRLTAHAGVAGTLVLNAMASPDLVHLPWHVVAPAVWSVLVEMTAREVLGEWKATHRVPADRIPLRLWLTAPVESARTWLLMARVGAGSHRVARVDVGVMAAATEALRLALPGHRPRRVRRIIRRQLRAGSLPPSDVLASLGWTGESSTFVTDPAAVLRATLKGVLTPEDVRPTDRATTGAASVEPLPVEPLPVEPPLAPAASEPSEADGAAAPVPAAHLPAAPIVDVLAVAAAEGGAREGGAREEAAREEAGRPGNHPPEGDLPGALDAPRRPFNDPIFPAPAVPVPFRGEAGAATGDFTTTGDRPSDAVALLRAQPDLTAAELADRLRALGWVLSERTEHRVFAEARHYLRGGRLVSVPSYDVRFPAVRS